MKTAHGMCLILFGAAMLVTPSASSAGTCGGIPGDKDICHCGDTVVVDPTRWGTLTVLTQEDPVAAPGGCPEPPPIPGEVPAALRVAAGVTLDLSKVAIECRPQTFNNMVGLHLAAGGGTTIIGDRGSVGIIRFCGAGIAGEFDFNVQASSNNTIQGVTILNSGFGIILGLNPQPGNHSDGNTLVGNTCSNNQFRGIDILGNGNTLANNFCSVSGLACPSGTEAGIVVVGSSNVLLSNQSHNHKCEGAEARGLVARGSLPGMPNVSDGNNRTKNNSDTPQCLIDGGFVNATRC